MYFYCSAIPIQLLAMFLENLQVCKIIKSLPTENPAIVPQK